MKTVRFIFSLSDSLHREVKIRSAIRNIDMGNWIRQAILQRIAYEQQFEEKKKD